MGTKLTKSSESFKWPGNWAFVVFPINSMLGASFSVYDVLYEGKTKSATPFLKLNTYSIIFCSPNGPSSMISLKNTST